MQNFRDCHLYHINPWILWERRLVTQSFMSVQLISTTLLSKTPNTGIPCFRILSFLCTISQLVVDWLVSRLYITESRSEVPKHGMKSNMGVEINQHPFMTSAEYGSDYSSFTRPGKWPDSRTIGFKRLLLFIFLSLLSWVRTYFTQLIREIYFLTMRGRTVCQRGKLLLCIWT
jgi:hypothetical protein